MIRALILGLCLGTSAAAGTLEGRLVTFTVMTWDDPAAPFLEARGRTVKVGNGVEFGLEPEGLTAGLDIVPVTVEISASRVELTYPRGMGYFYQSTFNGYVLRFETDCALFSAARVMPETTMDLTGADIRATPDALYVNVAGRRYGPDVKVVLDLDVEDCPLF